MVLVQRRISWSSPQPEKPDYKKDLNVGQEGVIVGWHDPEHRQLDLKVVLDLPSGPQQAITKVTFPRNLKLKTEATSAEPEGEKQPGEAEASEAACSSGKKPAFLSWAFGGVQPEQVRLEPKMEGPGF